MKLLEERIRKDGILKEGNVLKVDNFLNFLFCINTTSSSRLIVNAPYPVPFLSFEKLR